MEHPLQVLRSPDSQHTLDALLPAGRLEGSGYAVSTFWKSFRTNLKQGILLMLTFLFPVAFVIVSYLFADSCLGVFYKIISIAVGVITLSTFLYAFQVL